MTAVGSDDATENAVAAFRSAIADESSVYVIAEAGVNHDGDRETALDLVDAAADAGADAVKFQTFDADRLVSRDAPQADYQVETAPADSQHAMLEALELSRADHEAIRERCHEAGITFLSTPFDRESATFLDDFGVPILKLGSGELDNYPLLDHVAGFGRPIVLSTGMGTMSEVRAALSRIRKTDPGADVTVLHCTSAYPAAMDEVNLAAMRRLAADLSVPVGYSDHTTSVLTPGFAAASGASVLEKHFTLSRDREGPDHEASLEPDELATAVAHARSGAVASGRPEKRPTAGERANLYHVRKSLHATRDLSAGDRLAAEDVEALRPAAGLSPALIDDVVGRTLRTDVPAGEALTATALEGDVPPPPGQIGIATPPSGGSPRDAAEREVDDS